MASGAVKHPGDVPLVTLLLHTRNRPEFLSRTLAYLTSVADFASVRVHVVDGSSEEHWPAVRELIERRAGGTPQVVVSHSPYDLSALERVAIAIRQCETPYILPAPDDDFYLPGWLPRAIDQLESDRSITAVYGHSLFFGLDRYLAKGKLEEYFVHPRLAPPVPWLEADSASRRIEAITNRDCGPSVVGWYALQRTEQLRTIINDAVELGLPQEAMEYWLVFYQAVFGKTRMLDAFATARQIDDNAYHRTPSVKEAAPWLDTMRSAFENVIATHANEAESDATRLVNGYLAGVKADLHQNDITRWRVKLRHSSAVRTIKRLLFGTSGMTEQSHGRAYPDARLPALPQVGDDHPLVQLIRGWTAPDPGTPN